MRPARSSSAKTNARRGDAEAGVALFELIIYTALLLLVIGAALSSLESVTKAQAFQMNRSQTLASMRGALNRMTKELRQASSVDTAVSNATTMTFSTYVGSVSHTVTYRASGTVLTRALDAGTATPLLTGLSSTSIFTTVAGGSTADVQWVAIRLSVTASKGISTQLVLDSEVNLRNRTAALGGSA